MDLTGYLVNLGVIGVFLTLMVLLSNRMLKARLEGESKGRIKLFERMMVDPKRSFAVIGVGPRRWLVGMTDNHMDAIAELSAEDFPEPEAKSEQNETNKPSWWRWLGLGCLLLPFLAHPALAAPAAPTTNLLNTFDLRAPLSSPGLSTPLQLVFVMASLTLLPFLVMMTTSFVRTVIVLSFLRQALGTQGVPPNPVLIGIAIFLALFTMSPVWSTIDQNALQPYLKKTISQEVAFTRAVEPMQEFMVRQTSQPELAFFTRLANSPLPDTPKDVPLHVLIPAFMVSELATAFKIGFFVYIPFLVIDLVVANILMALGMSMLPPQMISTAFKILIFTLANGWHLIIQAIVQSFR